VGTPDVWDRINVQGTRRMLGAAQQAGARRSIHIGTEGALVRGQHLRGLRTQPDAARHTVPEAYAHILASASLQATRNAARNWRNAAGNESRHPSRRVRPRRAGGAHASNIATGAHGAPQTSPASHPHARSLTPSGSLSGLAGSQPYLRQPSLRAT
jgi:hypothetical protein